MTALARSLLVAGAILGIAAATTMVLAPEIFALQHGRLADASHAVDMWARSVSEVIAPSRLRRLLAPDPTQWWSTVAGVFVGAVAVVAVTAMWCDRRMAVTRLGRRRHELAGARPRAWARARDLRDLQVRGLSSRLELGTIGRPPRRLAVGPEAHIALFAPTGAGKSSRFVIPWVLQLDDCPLVVCSTKLDVVAATAAYRAECGRVWVWDPFGARSSGWTPLRGCVTWTGALKRAQWIAGAATGADGNDAARFWNGEAAKLLAPLLHAAALSHRRMADVLRWIDRPAMGVGEACEILEIGGASAALDQLQAVAGLDERNRGTTFMSAAHLLEAYRYPSVQATDREEISPAGLLDGRANTLYIVATDDEQRLLAPLVIAMIGELLAHRDRSDRSTQAPDSCLWLLLDETANIAPLEDLPRHLAGKRGSNVRFVTVWQDHAQLRRAYGASDGTVLSNSAVKVYLGPITDDLTRRYLDGVLGEECVETITRQARGGRSVGHVWRPRATAQAQQQLGHGRALLLHGHLLAALIETRPWFHRRAIARRRHRLRLRRMTNRRPVEQEKLFDQGNPDDASGRRSFRRSDAA